MPRNDNDYDNEDSCVLIGTPLVDLLPEDVKFTTKPKRQEEQIVTDERGKQRFHGAFTGGFSAGYFNSVGTKEGWTPASFKSNRSDKSNNSKNFQRPEDFMDDEDFNEHGIAPKQVKIKSDYKDEIKSKLSSQYKSGYLGMNIEDMIKPCRNTIGVKMMKKMGWREGQGVGPKIKRKLRRLKKKVGSDSGQKTYGVALPGSEESEEDNEFEDQILVSNFDVNEFQFEIKEDLFGLGYKRLDVTNIFNHNTSITAQESPAASLLFPMLEGSQKKGKPGMMSGQAFGTGDFDDDEDMYDIYKQDAKDSYNFDLGGQVQNDQKKLLEKNYGFDADISMLKNFIKGAEVQKTPKVFKGPDIPAGFDLMHKLSITGSTRESKWDTNDSMNMYLKTASERGNLLGEEAIRPESIMDLMSPSDKQFFMDQKQKQKDLLRRTETKRASDEINKEKKSQRYAEFISNCRKGLPDPYSSLDASHLTEWEKEKEKEEFTNIYNEQVRRVSEVKSNTSKFVSSMTLTAANEEELNTATKPIVTQPAVKSQTEEDQAVVERNFGKLTRKEIEFRPHPTLCKRFNVPNPYPNNICKIYGTVKDERSKLKGDKFSMFNYMTAQTRFDTSKSEKEKQGSSNKNTITLPNENEKTNEKIEFDSKNVTASSAESIFSDSKDTRAGKKNEPEEASTNIYLQKRPEIDLFKAIFEDSDEEEEPENIEKESPSEAEETTTPDVIKEVSTQATVIPSSISNINMKDISRYLEVKDDDEIAPAKYPEMPEPTAKIVFRKPGSSVNEKIESGVDNVEPKIEKFSSLIKSLIRDVSSDDSSGSGSSEASYEEVSVSSKSKNQKKKKDKKKKKKKKNSNKKSKKSHKKDKA